MFRTSPRDPHIYQEKQTAVCLQSPRPEAGPAGAREHSHHPGHTPFCKPRHGWSVQSLDTPEICFQRATPCQATWESQVQCLQQIKSHRKTTSPFLKWTENMRSFAQSCLTLCDPLDCSPPGASVCGDSGHWSGVPLPSPGDPPDPGMEPGSPAWQAGLLLRGPPQPFPESPNKSWSLRLHGPPVHLPSFKNPPALGGAGSPLGWADALILHECSRPLSCHCGC